MEAIRYIEKTHEYYFRKGNTEAYRYAKNEAGPFTPLRKPLADSRLILVGSAGIDIVPDDGPLPKPRS